MPKLTLNDETILASAWSALELLRMRLGHPASKLKDLVEYDRLRVQVEAMVLLLTEIEARTVEPEDNAP